MLKLAIVSVVATTFVGTALAQAETRRNEVRTERYEALAPSNVGIVDHESDMKVMGLSVPNGFRAPPAVDNRTR